MTPDEKVKDYLKRGVMVFTNNRKEKLSQLINDHNYPCCVELAKMIQAEELNTAKKASKKPSDKTYSDDAKATMQFFRDHTGKTHRDSEVNLKFVQDRLDSGITPEQLRQIIVIKTRAVKEGKLDKTYLRPETLFNKTKCESYLGEIENVNQG